MVEKFLNEIILSIEKYIKFQANKVSYIDNKLNIIAIR